MAKYRVWIAQVNQTFVEVEAASEIDAEDKAMVKWRREYAYPRVQSLLRLPADADGVLKKADEKLIADVRASENPTKLSEVYMAIENARETRRRAKRARTARKGRGR